MRYILDSGLPVDASAPEPVEGLKPASAEVKHMAQGSMALKRLKVYFGPHAAKWTPAYGNPFIDGSLVNWYHGDPTYDREQLRQSSAERMKRRNFEAFGLSVIVSN